MWCKTAAQPGQCPGEGAGSGKEQHIQEALHMCEQ